MSRYLLAWKDPDMAWFRSLSHRDDYCIKFIKNGKQTKMTVQYSIWRCSVQIPPDSTCSIKKDL